MKAIMSDIYHRLLFCKSKCFYNKEYRKIIKLNKISKKCRHEKEWIKKWSQFGFRVAPYQYRVFSHYIGENINIVPEEVCHYFFEPALNPKPYIGYYADKNVYDKLFPEGYFPSTIFRRMGDVDYTKDYQVLKLNDSILYEILSKTGYQKIIIKPSVNGASGMGIQLFEFVNGEWRNPITQAALNLNMLNSNFGSDFIVQEAIEQSEYLSQFNKSSVNTLRLSLYRSVSDNKAYITGAVLRIGKENSVVDNVHAGGTFVGINDDGTFCKEVFNQFGQRNTIFNSIDFSKEYKYPNWQKVIEFAKSVAQYVPHHRLLALDIALDKDNNPHLIEYNIRTFGLWVFQYTNDCAFRSFTDEILEYALKKTH